MFDPKVAYAAASDRIVARLAGVVEQMEAEAHEAREAAKAYAEHLAAGGSPSEGLPGRDDSNYARRGIRLVGLSLGCEKVYEVWNQARGSANPVTPFEGFGLGLFRVAEYAHAHIGEPMLFSTLADVWKGSSMYGGKGSSSDVSKALVRAQGDGFKVVRAKVDGKVAFILRELHEGEERSQLSSIPEEKAVTA